MRLIINKLTDSAQIPQYQSLGANGLDLHYSGPNTTLRKGQFKVFETGISIAFGGAYEAQIRSRSGLSSKQGLVVLNSPGTIDRDYTGEIKIILHNASDKGQSIKTGDRIAQMVFCPIKVVDDIIVRQASLTSYKISARANAIARGNEGVVGFGSTG